MSKSNITKAYDILKDYAGPNPYVKSMARQMARNGKVLNDFEVEYINANHDFEPLEVNRIFQITPELGDKLVEKYGCAFKPEKIRITKVIGELKGTYHAYFQYRQSEGPQLAFLSKRGIMGQVVVVDWKAMEPDFSLIETMSEARGEKLTLRGYQKDGVKFLIGNQKCICADEQGTGKSLSSLSASILAKCKHTLIISPASLKTNWKRECLRLVNTDEVEVLNGSNWKGGDKKFTIINYEIIQNFYEVAYEPVFETVEIKDADGNVTETYEKPVMVKNSQGKLVQKMKKSRKKEDIKQALANSPLFLNDYDCVIIDEAQKLSNNTSRRYKTIKDFLVKAAPRYVFLLTGTPLTNNPMNLYHILNLIDADVVKNYKYYIERFCGAKEHTRKDGHKYITYGEFQNLDELREKIKSVYIRRLTSDTGEMVKKNIERVYYELTEEEQVQYNRLWQDYLDSQEGRQISLGEQYDDFWSDYDDNSDSEKHRQLIEGGLIKQFLGRCMVSRTEELVDGYIEDGEKVVVVTVYRKEMEMLKDYYGDKCVTFQGGMTPKQKDRAVDAFKTDKNVKVMLLQLIAGGVGLNLEVATKLVFNNFGWVYADNAQVESRIHRLTQTQDVTCTYQLFDNTIGQEMFDKVLYKQYLSESLIKSETEKK